MVKPLPPFSGSKTPKLTTLPDGTLILGRQPGESAYQYRYRRTVTMYGQTPYQRRIFLAQQRGIQGGAARGHGIVGGETESQRRNRISRQNTGFSVSQLRRTELRQWLEDYGYTPDTTGMSWTNLIRLAPRLRWMYTHTSPGARVLPLMIYNATQLERDNDLPAGWAFERLWRKYDDMMSFRMFADKDLGRESWAEYMQVGVFIPQVAIQFWYYH
ncbi:MAG TPA: hypothetical protein VGR89_00465 [Puia sp.]|nr:hypothetical protein [Puia sp.]